ncbi:MAG: hypothetical protein V3U98_09950 [Acidobacteriota bacterium]
MEQAVICYIEAVQDQDGTRWAGCAAPDLLATVAGESDLNTGIALHEQATARLGERARAFLDQRQAGMVDISAVDGILLTHYLSLGRGTYYVFHPPEQDGGQVRLRMEARLFYRLIDFPRHRRRGEVFWRLGRPLGSIYPILSGMTQMGTREELSRVELEWILEPGPDSGWWIRSVRLLPETAVFVTRGE